MFLEYSSYLRSSYTLEEIHLRYCATGNIFLAAEVAMIINNNWLTHRNNLLLLNVPAGDSEFIKEKNKVALSRVIFEIEAQLALP